ncbi:MAG: glycogen/starch/alpha-glucan phosphorylase, partial [Synechococcus sp.]|nr:glycogen/starch/alpha-glucan phosphorylase [Synechococcus sp.]
EVGSDNFFLFGHTAEGIEALRNGGHHPWEVPDTLPDLREALDLIGMGHFSDGDAGLFQPLLRSLIEHDPFFVLADLADYLRAQQEVDRCWHEQSEWQRRSLLNTARSGFFSSDRSIAEYAATIWNVQPLPLEMGCTLDPGRAGLSSNS